MALSAVSVVSIATIKFGKELINGMRSFAIWDVVAVSNFRARATQADTIDEAAAATAAIAAASVSPHGHHTIPVYLCGSMNQETSVISRPEHSAIHLQIAAIKVALDGAEEFATRTVGRHRTAEVLKIAQTQAGRVSITNALDEVYFWGGWWPRGVRPIKDVLESERRSFESGANTSLPWCSRSGAP